MRRNSIVIEQNLQHIANMLLLNGTLTECPGLVYGKMGIVIFFFHLSRYTDNTLFVDYALDLIGEVQNQLYPGNRVDYGKGIAGIGVGIDYLIQKDFLDAGDNIFEDLDDRMYRAVMYEPCLDFSLYDGLTGYGRYWISRLRRQPSFVLAEDCLIRITERIEEKFPEIPIEERADVYCFLHDLYETPGIDISIALLEQNEKKSEYCEWYFSRLDNSAIGNFIQMYNRNRYFKNMKKENMDMVALNKIPALDMEKPPFAMGLLSGYAGEGMLRLTALDPWHAPWMKLL